MNWLAVFIGGGIGSVLRYGLSLAFRHLELTSFPIATLAANVLSCLLLGWLVFRFSWTEQPTLAALLIVGVCGGFSTFSTFSLETLQLMRSGQTLWAIINVALSIAVCIIILFAWSKTINE